MKKIYFSSFFFICFALFYFLYPKTLESATLNLVKDTLSTSQLSYFGRLGIGHSANDTTIRVALSANPSNSTANLFVGDTVAISRNPTSPSPLDQYIVGDIATTATFQITTGLGSTNIGISNAVIATRSAIHTVAFTPVSNLTAGIFQFLIKATTRSGEDFDDGIPDQQGFDFGQDVGGTTIGTGTRLKTADVTCPLSATAGVGTTIVVGSNSYHLVTCTLGVGITNQIGVGYTITVGRALTTGSQLINPAPALSHTPGQADSTADVYDFYVRHLDSGSNVIDTTRGRIAVVESVRVTATVDPTLTFIIDATGVGAGSTHCNATAYGSNASNTTATAVKFGSISLSAFNDLSQRLSCVTNADDGYVVTAYEADQMKNIASGTTIPDSNCDGSCSYTATDTWTVVDSSISEWGYSLQNVAGTPAAFTYATGWKAFGEGSAQAQTIMSNASTPTTTERVYACYRLSVTTLQEAGDYENRLVYTATATF